MQPRHHTVAAEQLFCRVRILNVMDWLAIMVGARKKSHQASMPQQHLDTDHSRMGDAVKPTSQSPKIIFLLKHGGVSCSTWFGSVSAFSRIALHASIH
ncbi:hypothetical protein TNCV_2089771 [Trichonephila clavipes]|nr:hypothetical protein TNCV_2089771 [Trichonephila clavipes]